MRRFQDDQTQSVNNAKHLALLLIFYGLILGAIYFLTEEIVVRKIVLSLVLPVGFCWISLLSVTYFLIVNHRRWLALFCMLLTVVFSLAGNKFLTNALASSLERPYLDFRVKDSPEYDVLVLLGGATKFGGNEQSQLNAAGDRVMVALQMYEQGKTKKILCTGSPVDSLNHPDEPSAAEQSVEILHRCGVPRESLDLLDGRNTKEEIANLAKEFKDSKLKIGIISSAWHLPRVMRLVQTTGLKAEPVPANFLSGIGKFDITGLVPSAGAMSANSSLIKEMLAKSLGQ